MQDIEDERKNLERVVTNARVEEEVLEAVARSRRRRSIAGTTWPNRTSAADPVC